MKLEFTNFGICGGKKLENPEKNPRSKDKNQHKKQRSMCTMLGPGFQPKTMVLDKPSDQCAI